ncbi:uncharacterized protein BXZ73DRAFT_81806 [Epithele typhae]|uniref:uncharacterized protein n=1 Tax=Epithele typhae TaxID=378194 RepID=UPI0020080DB0|nr:uncharacterized protein BXZ73DRAFT_81806 [Epithele typhae]KAH9913889.1 hypothetical protein BXZ73DRAFT_81806 [Epithele typhae]
MPVPDDKTAGESELCILDAYEPLSEEDSTTPPGSPPLRLPHGDRLCDISTTMVSTTPLGTPPRDIRFRFATDHKSVNSVVTVGPVHSSGILRVVDLDIEMADVDQDLNPTTDLLDSDVEMTDETSTEIPSSTCTVSTYTEGMFPTSSVIHGDELEDSQTVSSQISNRLRSMESASRDMRIYVRSLE